MKITRKVRSILDNYSADSPGVKANLARILMQGKLAGTGKLVILPATEKQATEKPATEKPAIEK